MDFACYRYYCVHKQSTMVQHEFYINQSTELFHDQLR